MAAAKDTAGFQCRIPPQDLNAEMACLASLMLAHGAIDEVGFLRAEHFYADRNQKIFEICVALHEQHTGIDAVTVATALETAGRLSEVGGVEYLGKLLETVPNAAHVAFYGRTVFDKATARSVLYTCTELSTLVYDHHGPAQEIVEQAEMRVMAIRDSNGTTETHTFSEVLHDALAAIEMRIGNQQAVSGLATGWTRFDERLSGMQPGNLIIVAARPSMGKTAFACGLSLGALKTGPVLFLSLEQSRLELAERCLAITAGIDGHRLRNGQLNSIEMQMLGDASAELSALPLFIDERNGLKVFEIAALARRMKRKHGLKLVVIDYLQLIEPEDSRTPREQQVATISRRLKALARELQVPIVVLAQLNREVENRPDKRPRVSDLRESGSIEQDADVVILLHRPEVYDPDDRRGEADVIIGKHRNGPIGTVVMTWHGQFLRFGEPAHCEPGPNFQYQNLFPQSAS